MGNLGSLIAIPLTIILVPLILRRMPYFRRPDVVARRVAKAQLPGWVSLVEMIFLGAFEGVLIILFFLIEAHVHQALHQGKNLFGSAPQASSFSFVFWLIQICVPLMMALPLGMLMANLMSWLIPPIRNIENEIMAKGVPGYTWHDANYGLIKFSLVTCPICLILAAISLMRV